MSNEEAEILREQVHDIIIRLMEDEREMALMLIEGHAKKALERLKGEGES